MWCARTWAGTTHTTGKWPAVVGAGGWWLERAAGSSGWWCRQGVQPGRAAGACRAACSPGRPPTVPHSRAPPPPTPAPLLQVRVSARGRGGARGRAPEQGPDAHRGARAQGQHHDPGPPGPARLRAAALLCQPGGPQGGLPWGAAWALVEGGGAWRGGPAFWSRGGRTLLPSPTPTPTPHPAGCSCCACGSRPTSPTSSSPLNTFASTPAGAASSTPLRSSWSCAASTWRPRARRSTATATSPPPPSGGHRLPVGAGLGGVRALSGAQP